MEDIALTRLDVEDQSGTVLKAEDDNVGDALLINTQSQNLETLQAGVEMSDFVHAKGGRIDLNVFSHVEEVVAAILEVLGQGQPYVEFTVVVVEEKLATMSLSKEAKVVI